MAQDFRDLYILDYLGAPAPGFGAPPAGERPRRPAGNKFLLV